MTTTEDTSTKSVERASTISRSVGNMCSLARSLTATLNIVVTSSRPAGRPLLRPRRDPRTRRGQSFFAAGPRRAPLGGRTLRRIHAVPIVRRDAGRRVGQDPPPDSDPVRGPTLVRLPDRPRRREDPAPTMRARIGRAVPHVDQLVLKRSKLVGAIHGCCVTSLLPPASLPTERCFKLTGRR